MRGGEPKVAPTVDDVGVPSLLVRSPLTSLMTVAAGSFALVAIVIGTGHSSSRWLTVLVAACAAVVLAGLTVTEALRQQLPRVPRDAVLVTAVVVVVGAAAALQVIDARSPSATRGGLGWFAGVFGLAVVSAGWCASTRWALPVAEGAAALALASTATASLIAGVAPMTGTVAAAGVLLAAGILAHHLAHWRGAVYSELERQRERAESSSTRDELTALLNAQGMRMLAAPMMEAARRDGNAIHCEYLDVDSLGRVNGALGPEAGDEVLLAVAESLSTSVRGSDVVARLSLDKFIVLGPGTGMPPGELQRRVRARLLEHPPVPRSIWPARVSVGASTLEPWDAGDLDDLVRGARQDMTVRRALTRPGTPGPTRPPLQSRHTD